MKKIISKKCLFSLLSFFVFVIATSNTASASYQKLTYKRAMCPANPFAANASYASCPLNKGTWVWVDKVDPRTRDIFVTEIVNDGVQFVNIKTKKVAASFKGPEATVFLLMEQKNIVTKEVLVEIIASTYKISPSNAKSYIARVEKVLSNLNRFRSLYRSSRVPFQYEVYKFY